MAQEINCLRRGRLEHLYDETVLSSSVQGKRALRKGTFQQSREQSSYRFTAVSAWGEQGAARREFLSSGQEGQDYRCYCYCFCIMKNIIHVH